jgi:DNA mismatch repair protein MutL
MSQLYERAENNLGQRPARRPIVVLPDEVAERIAAGEVIERPVSVIKELVENALDAQARAIRIEVRGGGLRLMRVSDDGIGIPEDELERACLRHSTSKLSTIEDLERLGTLGFRGEALASIATIAEMTLESRASETGDANEERPAQFVTLRGGEVVERGRKARVPGTTVTVRDLFFNVPARLKFIRGARTENGHILHYIRRYALGYPGVRFTLVLDEHIALQTSGSGELKTALTEIYSLPLNEMLYEVERGAGEQYRIHGYIGNRVLAQNNRQYVTLFVNGRWVQSRALYDAVEKGYRGLLAKGKHPLLVLFIEVAPNEVDVNVHPAKTEVRLLREREVLDLLTESVQAVLERSPVLPEEIKFPGPVLATQRRLPGAHRRGLHMSETAEEYLAEAAPPASAEAIAQLRPLAQLQRAVILAEAPDGSLYLVDQHRAHERVIYEHLRQRYAHGIDSAEDEEGGAVNGHLLLEPVIVELKRHQAELLEERLPMLRGLGLECERFGGRSFLVRSIPGGEGYEQLAGQVEDLVQIAAEDNEDWEHSLLIGLSCRSALRRGRELSQGEQQSLLTSLARTSVPAVCPHGSPILLHYSRSFLIEKFDW